VSLACDVTVAHTLATSYVSQNARKTTNYSTPSASHDVSVSVAVETLGPLSDEAHSLIAETGRRATLCTADPRETTFLYQRISVAVQRCNEACLQCLANTFTVSESPS